MIEYRQATLLRISLANSVGFSASTAVPIWVASAGAHFGFPSWGAGAVATGQLACAALLNATTPWLFRGAHLKKLAFVAAAVAFLGNGLAWLGSSPVFIAGCLLCGAAFGVLLNVTNRLVASSSAPQRGYAVVQLVEVLFCIAILPERAAYCRAIRKFSLCLRRWLCFARRSFLYSRLCPSAPLATRSQWIAPVSAEGASKLQPGRRCRS